MIHVKHLNQNQTADWNFAFGLLLVCGIAVPAHDLSGGVRIATHPLCLLFSQCAYWQGQQPQGTLGVWQYSGFHYLEKQKEVQKHNIKTRDDGGHNYFIDADNVLFKCCPKRESS